MIRPGGNDVRTLFLASILLISCATQPYRTGNFDPWTPPTDMNLNAFLAYLVTEGSSWILSQREILRPTSTTLSVDYRDRYAAYFRPKTLDAVRHQLVDIIENPGFYDELSERGLDIPLDFSRMDGIAFVDTISISRQNLREVDLTRLLFHECVHVAQYRYLGVAEFVSQYVDGWANGGFNYFAIPLEIQAYELEQRFSRGEIFSVEDAVAESFDRS